MPSVIASSRFRPWFADITFALPCQPLASLARIPSAPLQRHANVAGDSAAEIDDLDPQPVTEWPQSTVPEFINFLRNSCECSVPTRLLLIDRPSPIGTKCIGEAVDLHFSQAILGGTLDDGCGLLHHLLVGQPRWFS